MIHTDYLIIGSGIAGLTVAVKIAEQFPSRKVMIVTKAEEGESNTKYAQGGIAVVINSINDSYEKHIKDTLIAGDGLCDPEVVEMVITEGTDRFKELLKWGTEFDTNEKGDFDLGREGGHSENRVVHHKDQTGYEIERAILAQIHQKKNITVLDYHFATDLITENNSCIGVSVLNQKNKEKISIYSPFTLLATGGIGSVYGHTTNPEIATGDGIAMAFRANVMLKEMEFIQFHPTALYDTTSSSAFLISEAVRGFGAFLRTKSGHRFMLDYDERAELACRDIVSQSIDLELKKTNDKCVYLDCTHLDLNTFVNYFPMIYHKCKSLGINLVQDWIPVVPTQHYLCGGIVVDKNGKTSLENLFACGECSRTGLHGANRLASNSLLEALVYSHNIYNYWAHSLVKKAHPVAVLSTEFSDKNKAVNPDYIFKMKSELQLLMRKNAGIVRKNADLFVAKEQLGCWKKKVEQWVEQDQTSTSLYELRNLIEVGLLILQQSLERNENRGGFMKVNN